MLGASENFLEILANYSDIKTVSEMESKFFKPHHPGLLSVDRIGLSAGKKTLDQI